jgi:hypothetical protein
MVSFIKLFIDMIKAKLEFEQAIDDYIRSCMNNGDMIEDVVDDIERIVEIKTDEWFDKDPIPSPNLNKNWI